jgi:hypothetical protein
VSKPEAIAKKNETTTVRLTMRGRMIRTATVDVALPATLDEEGIVAAVDPIAEALGQCEFDSTGSLEGCRFNIYALKEEMDDRQTSAQCVKKPQHGEGHRQHDAIVELHL